MQVTKGSEWVTEAGNRQQFAVSFDLDDLRHTKGEEYVDGLTNAERFTELSNSAEKMILKGLLDEGIITVEYAQQRLAALS